MGSTVRFNDTLQITAGQGFPAELDLSIHLHAPFSINSFIDREFSFSGKPGIRNFQQEPVVNFLVQNIPAPDGSERHVYWGHVIMLSIIHDYAEQVTSGIFQITKIFTPEEMRHAPIIIGLNPAKDYLVMPYDKL